MRQGKPKRGSTNSPFRNRNSRQEEKGTGKSDFAGNRHKGGTKPQPFRGDSRPAVPVGTPETEFSHLPGYWLYGHHAVSAALANSRRKILRRLEIEDQGKALGADPRPLPDWQRVDRATIERLLGRDCVHQGIAARVLPLPECDVEDILEAASGRDQACILILDQVTDPQNVGAILRSAAAFGAIGAILTERHAAPESGLLAKAASGALDYVPVARIVNLVRAMARLKEAGFWCIGLAAEAPQTLAEAKLSGRVALCLGAEGSGLRRLTRENCDLLLRLPSSGPISHLNVSNAAAVALYELNR